RLARLARRFAVVFVGESTPAPAAPPATPTAATAPAASAAPAAPATRCAPLRLGARFIYFQIASAHFFAVQSGDGLGGLFVLRHFHKRKSARSSGLAVRGYVDARHP